MSAAGHVAAIAARMKAEKAARVEACRRAARVMDNTAGDRNPVTIEVPASLERGYHRFRVPTAVAEAYELCKAQLDDLNSAVSKRLEMIAKDSLSLASDPLLDVYMSARKDAEGELRALATSLVSTFKVDWFRVMCVDRGEGAYSCVCASA